MKSLEDFYREGMYELPKDEAKANEWKNKGELKRLHLLIQEGSGKAMHALGYAHANGLHGLGKDEVEAYRWYEKSSKAGDTTGRAFLAHCQINGQGTTKKLGNGLLLLMSAANSGSDCACYFLGEIYFRGLHETTKSSEDAKDFFDRALYSGSSCRKSGYLKDRDMANARRWLGELNGDEDVPTKQKPPSSIVFCDCGGECGCNNNNGFADARRQNEEQTRQAESRASKDLDQTDKCRDERDKQEEGAKHPSPPAWAPKSPRYPPPSLNRPTSPPYYPKGVEGDIRVQYRQQEAAAAKPASAQRASIDRRAGLPPSEKANTGNTSTYQIKNAHRMENKSTIKDTSPKRRKRTAKRLSPFQADTTCHEAAKPANKYDSGGVSMPDTFMKAKKGRNDQMIESDEEDNGIEWVQCEKCEKWRKLPSHVAAKDLPEVWHCNMNTWNPDLALCSVDESSESFSCDDDDCGSDNLSDEDGGNISSYSDELLSESDDVVDDCADNAEAVRTNKRRKRRKMT